MREQSPQERETGVAERHRGHDRTGMPGHPRFGVRAVPQQPLDARRVRGDLCIHQQAVQAGPGNQGRERTGIAGARKQALAQQQQRRAIGHDRIVIPHRNDVDNSEKCSGMEGVAFIRSITTSPVVEHPDSENPR